MIGSLLATKTFLPTLQKHVVVRSRLLARLDDSLQLNHRLILVSASAGAGKSTLMAEWAARLDRPMAWVSLDRDDNDPIRFWTYLIVAVQTRYPGACQPLLEVLRSASPVSVMALLPELLNDLTGLSGSGLVIAIDDYHLIESQPVHESLIYFIEHLPPNIHLIVATRSDPPLPLHRWRARGLLAEVRFDDLRFTLDETEDYLNGRMNLQLRAGDVEQLERRTEGWAVGLQLAALSLKGRADASEFIARFSASHHFVLEYLSNEVLAQLSESDQEFVAQISILKRFCAPLCQQVTGRTDADRVLGQLWQANLFLIPLDDEHYWFRFHHLFGDLLTQRLKSHDETYLLGLHQRAADWFSDNKLIDEALRHALAAKNLPFAANLVSRNWRRASFEGLIRTTRTWLESLPAELAANDPLLCVANAWTLYQMGQTRSVMPHIENAFRSLARLEAEGKVPQDDFEYTTIPANMTALRAALSVRMWDFEAGVRYGEEAIRIAPPNEPLPVGLGWLGLGQAQREMGNFEEAIGIFRRSIPINRAYGNISAIVNAAYSCGRLLHQQGRMRSADELYAQTLAEAREDGQDAKPACGILRIGQGDLQYERNQLGPAAELLAEGWQQSKRGGYLEFLKAAGILQARIFRVQGNLDGALAAIQEVLSLVERVEMILAIAEVRAWLARLQADAGDLVSAARWAAEVQPVYDHNPGITQGTMIFSLVRVWLAQGKHEAALAALGKVEPFARAQGSTGRLIEILTLQATAWMQSNRQDAAARAMAECVRLATPEGYVRTILDEGEPARRALRLAQSERLLKEPAEQEWLASLLAAFPPADSPAAGVLVGEGQERLSEREIEVLRLMSQGFTNPEIAERLVVATSTIKTHLNNIYGKMGVRNRAEAVTRAKELGLL